MWGNSAGREDDVSCAVREEIISETHRCVDEMMHHLCRRVSWEYRPATASVPAFVGFLALGAGTR